MEDISKFTKKQIADMTKTTSKIANAKLKEMRNAGYDQYNYSMVRKYNALTTYSSSTMNNVTKKGLFRSGGYSKFTKEQLIHRYEIMTEFINNPYATVEYSKRHLEEMRDKWSLDDEEIKDMFSLYREYGYDNYADSEAVLQSFSKIMGDSPSERDPSDHLRNVLHSISNELDNKGKAEKDYVDMLKKEAKFLT